MDLTPPAASASAGPPPGDPGPRSPAPARVCGRRCLGLGAGVSLASCLAWSATLPAGSATLAVIAQVLGVAIALAATLGPLVLALAQPRWDPGSAVLMAAGSAAGCLLGGLAVCLPGLVSGAYELSAVSAALATVAALGYGIALVTVCTGVQRLLGSLGLRPLTALGWTWLAAGLLYAAPTLVSPVLEALPSPVAAASVTAIIRLHPRTVVEGTCFGLDPVRGRTLYTGFRVSTSHPYEYGGAVATVLTWLLLAPLAHVAAFTMNRNHATPSQNPELAPLPRPER